VVADENLRNAIVRGLLRRHPALDIVRAQDVFGVAGRDDKVLLRYATDEGRLVLTHDVTTMMPAMREHLRLGSQCAPVVFMSDSISVALAIEQLLLLNECAEESDWAAGVLYLPLR
jgi:hypothetical protein